MKQTRLMTGLALASLFVVGSVRADEALILPPAPVSSQPPAVDLTILAEMRATRIEPLQMGKPVADFARPIATVASVPMASSTSLNGILKDVSGKSDIRRNLESMLFDQLRKALPGSEDFLLEQATIPESIQAPQGDWSVNYDFRLPSAGIGRATYSATLRDRKSGEAQRFSGTVSIDREAPGVTVTRLVRNGETIGPGDVQELKARLSQLPRGTLDSMDLAIGAKARKEIRPGEWLTDQLVGVPDMIKRGQGVTMRLVRGPLTITAPGIAMQAGGRGQVIRIQNAQTKKDIFAKVISKEEVQVIN